MYPPEAPLDEDEDNGTMPGNVAELAESVVGHRIVSTHQVLASGNYGREYGGLVITLDSGVQVSVMGESDCCAFTTLDKFLLHPEKVDHIITGVATENGYTRWHIYADAGDVLDLEVSWSCGNPFYYAYGFIIEVQAID